MEMFDVHRRDVYNFDDYMDLSKPGFGGPKSAEPLKDSKGKRVKSNPKLADYQRVVKRHEAFKHQVWDPTYKAMGGDLVHKQEVGKNPYDYVDLYDRMGVATVDMGKYTGKTANGNIANESFSHFVNECNCGMNPIDEDAEENVTETPKKGQRVTLISMVDKYTKLKKGDQGTVEGVDGIGNILVKWDSGSTLSLIPGVDEYEIGDESEESDELEDEIDLEGGDSEEGGHWIDDLANAEDEELPDEFEDDEDFEDEL